MIAIIHAPTKDGEVYLEEGFNEDTLFPHATEEALLDSPTPHIVVHKAYNDSLPGLVDEGVGEGLTHLVVLDDIVFEMDVVGGGVDGLKQGIDHGLTLGVDGGEVFTKGHRTIHPTEKGGERKTLRGKVEWGLAPKSTQGLASNSDERALADNALLAYTLTKKEVEQKAQHGKENKYHHPRKSLDRMAIVEYHHHHSTQHHREVDDVEYEAYRT